LNNGALGATAGALNAFTAGTDLLNTSGFVNDDVIKITANGQNLFVKVKASATSGTNAGNTVATAIEVATVEQLRTVISGKQINGTTDIDLDAATGVQNLGLTASIDLTAAAGNRFRINSAGTAPVSTAFELQRTGVASALAQTLFGGAAGPTVTNISTTTSSASVASQSVGLSTGDVVAVKIGTGNSARSVYAKVVTNFSVPGLGTGVPNTQFGDGTSETNAIEVRTLGDLANAFSGKKANGVDLINTVGVGQNNFSVNVDADSTGSKLKVSSNATTTFTVKASGGSYNGAAAVALFGGTQTTGTGGTTPDVDFNQPGSGSTNIVAGTRVAANLNAGGLLVNDLIAFDVGPESNRTTLTVKVVANYTGPVVGGQATQRGNGKGNAYTGTDGPLEVKSIGDLVNALNARDKNNAALSDFSWNNNPSVRATFDASNTTGAAPAAGRFNFTAGTRVAIGVTRFGAIAATAGAIFGAGGAGGVGAGTSISGPAPDGTLTSTQVIGTTINNQAKEQRLSAAKAYRDTLDSIDRLTTDAQINGLNLLRNATGFDAVLSETATQNVRLRSTVTNAASLGFTVINNIYQDGAQAEFATNTDVDLGLAKVDAAIASLGGRDTELDVQTSLLTERRSFNSDIIEGLGNLSNDLTAVNQEEASAQAAAASFSSNAALKFLGVSGQRASQLLQIF
jgi:hypothetical protein